ncbi:MAG: hypothetical protein Q8N09_03375 [Thermodesulfovibrionia bacterium]|nr:hypothetical protein [Thermodesulfovibrionia bacterium]
MRKYDKSLIEVWEWKEKVYGEVRNLSPKEYIEKIRADADKILSEGQIKLQTIPSKEKKKKVA